MIQLFHNVNIDWLGKRKFFIGLSIVLMLSGMGTALYRHRFHPKGTEAFNLGVDFKGGTVVTARWWLLIVRPLVALRHWIYSPHVLNLARNRAHPRLTATPRQWRSPRF